MTWDERFAQFRSLRDAGMLGEWRSALELELRRIMLRPSAGDVAWLEDALVDPGRRPFAVMAVRQAWRVPEPLFIPVVRAAVLAGDVSQSRALIEPAVTTFGHRSVNEVLLDIFASGSTQEKLGAVRALYWAQPPLETWDRSRGTGLDAASPDARRAWLALSDLWARKDRLYLEEFVHNEAPEVRSALIPHLDLEPRRHPPELRALVLEAARLALEHDDPYVRRRVEGLFGMGTERTVQTRYRREIAG
ncbi:MAG TPA: hypothetical protein VFV75_00015 [Candidatus Polarisedimenticolaceae bacterium]|nr:hypothetical protein [Candidatus Polarisedimenticolaceae bacterium]